MSGVTGSMFTATACFACLNHACGGGTLLQTEEITDEGDTLRARAEVDTHE